MMMMIILILLWPVQHQCGIVRELDRGEKSEAPDFALGLGSIDTLEPNNIHSSDRHRDGHRLVG